MLETKHVRDYSGKLIPRNKARRIEGSYYEEGVTCIKMPDGQWYRTTTDKIRFDWETKNWVFTSEASELIKGLVDDGSTGYFSRNEQNNVVVFYKKETQVRSVKVNLFAQTPTTEDANALKKVWIKGIARTAEIAEKYGFMESFQDGVFYRKDDMTDEDKRIALMPGTPSKERSNTYSLDDDPTTRNQMEKLYKEYVPEISKGVRKLARYIPYTFGLEFESSVGHIPARLRGKLGVRPLRDGSIAGIEYVTIPLEGGKGINTIKELTSELTKRCQTTNACSVHVHFGNVRRDKGYILSLWRLALLIQEELLGYFPYSRTNSIRPDGKVYCKPLESHDIDMVSLLTVKNKEEFQAKINKEFNKIYGFLNNNHITGENYQNRLEKQEKILEMGGKQVRAWRLINKAYYYSTKTKTHSIRGNKWERPQRYYWLNLLPTFFGPETIEFRPHETSFSYERVIMWMLTCAAILEFAKDTKKCYTARSITLEEVIKAYLPVEAAKHLLGYWKERKARFQDRGRFKRNWEDVEAAWLEQDKNYKFNGISIEDLL